MFQYLVGDLEPEAVSPLVLAYIGDAVYELYIRLLLVAHGERKMKDLHQQTVFHVRAEAQASFLKDLEPILTAEEAHVVRRGRNAKSGQGGSKGSGIIAYRLSTGFEALIGYLYLKGKEERLVEILTELDSMALSEEEKMQ